MEKIEKYITAFFKHVHISDRYDMEIPTHRAISDRAKEDPSDATRASFLYGYARGYRAAMAEMKKGGAA